MLPAVILLVEFVNSIFLVDVYSGINSNSEVLLFGTEFILVPSSLNIFIHAEAPTSGPISFGSSLPYIAS